MTAQVCKKCSRYINRWCTRKGMSRNPWDSMCDEELAERSARVDKWLEGHGKGAL